MATDGTKKDNHTLLNMSAVAMLLTYAMAVVATIMITAKAVKKIKAVPIMMAAACVQIIILGSLFFASAGWAVVLISLAGFACAPFFPLIMSWMVGITGNESSSMIALTMATGTLGPVILSIITGIFSQIQGTQYLMAVPTFCFALLFVMLIAFKNVKSGKEEA